jgi:hypothetical protein
VGTTETIPIKFIAPKRRRHLRGGARASAAAESGPVNVDAGPPLAPGYGR